MLTFSRARAVSRLCLLLCALPRSTWAQAAEATETAEVAEAVGAADTVEVAETREPWAPPPPAYASEFDVLSERETAAQSRLAQIKVELREARAINRQAGGSYALPITLCAAGLGISAVTLMPLLLEVILTTGPHSSGSIHLTREDRLRIAGGQFAGAALALTGFAVLRIQQSQQPLRKQAAALQREYAEQKLELDQIRRDRRRLRYLPPEASIQRHGAQIALGVGFD